MLLPYKLITILLTLNTPVISTSIPHISSSPQSTAPATSSQHIRFHLHIDPYFNPRSDPDQKCHGKSLSRHYRSPPAYYGIPQSGCDSPPLLVNETLEYIRSERFGVETTKESERWRKGKGREEMDERTEEFGFVLWTGDSSRHDRDGRIPKTEKEVFEANAAIVTELLKTFDPIKTPIVPSIGNWDTFPAGDLPSIPNTDPTLKTLWSLWSPLFPSAETNPETRSIQSTFLRGGFFSRTLVQNALTALSINTLSFFESNRALRGDCTPFSEPNPRLSISFDGTQGVYITRSINETLSRKSSQSQHEHPGDVQIVWLEEELLAARRQGRRIIVAGHVPPVTPDASLFLPNCLDWYTYLWGEFSDVIVMQYFGHINKDILHLLLARRSTSSSTTNPRENPYHVQSLTPTSFSNIDLTVHTIASIMSTSASIVPAFNPGFRIGTIELNTTHHPEPSTPNPPPHTIYTATLLSQSTYFADIIKANRKRDRLRMGDGKKNELVLTFERSCSTREDFGLQDMNPSTIEAWMGGIKLNARADIGKAMKKYARCIEVSVDLSNGGGGGGKGKDRIGFKDPLVQKILVGAGVVILFMSVLGTVYLN
ncbi:Endopolyphosphatase [Phlyctochytrium planicorne]|nr:Endopolyphosphatase [Phlyctochytrium planicorne]KAJ3099815.1 Endopolyphosphatase [Phlyctochytrium planicorne]